MHNIFPVGLDSEKRLFLRKDAKRGKMVRKEEKRKGKRGIQDKQMDTIWTIDNKEDFVLT